MTNRAFHDAMYRQGNIPVEMLRLSLNRQKVAARLSGELEVLRPPFRAATVRESEPYAPAFAHSLNIPDGAYIDGRAFYLPRGAGVSIMRLLRASRDWCSLVGIQ